MDGMSIHRKIKEGRKRLGMTEQQFADAVGVSRGAVQQWEKEDGTAPRRAHQAAVARLLGMSIGEMVDSDSTPVETPENAGFVPIRRVLFKLSAGTSGFAVDFLDNGDGEPLFFRSEWFKKRGFNPSKCYAMPVTGESMEPELRAGDVVVVNTGATDPVDGAVFAVNYEGSPVIKRLVRDAGNWWLQSDNQDQRRYARKVCDDGVFIIG